MPGALSSFTRMSLVGVGLTALAACELPPPDPEVVAQQCEERARAAQGPTGNVTIGANSNTGPFSSVEIGVTSDFLLGRDPNTVYSECVYRETGSAPYRPPNL